MCQLISSETTQQNFVKFCSYEEVTVQKCIFTENFVLDVMLFFYLLAKIKYTTETVCQRNSSETSQQIFIELCSYDGHTFLIFFFAGSFAFLELLKQFVIATSIYVFLTELPESLLL